MSVLSGCRRTQLLPVEPPSPFVDTSEAEWCANGPDTLAIAWLGVVNVIIFMGFLLRLRWLAQEVARESDLQVTAQLLEAWIKLGLGG